LSGVSRFLFVPLAEAVVFAMLLVSYVLSRTLLPTLATHLLREKEVHSTSRNIFTRFQRAFEGGFEKLRTSYRLLLTKLVLKRKVFVPAFLGVCLCAFLLLPWLGQDFFPNTDSGEFILHVSGKTGLRIEDQARLCDLVENVIRREIPEKEVGNILDNIGLPYSPLNTLRRLERPWFMQQGLHSRPQAQLGL
jgi:multidrug efflux pump subunit AcrB